MTHRDELAAAGWGFLPVYVGLQINQAGLSAAAGTSDGQAAAQLSWPRPDFIRRRSAISTWKKVLGWWVRGLGRPNPFFDDRSGEPLSAPRVLALGERTADGPR